MGGRRAAAGAVLVAFALAACDGGDGNGGGIGAPSSTPTTGAAAAATTTTEACPAGGRSMTLRGVRVRQFCGPALAELTLGEELLVFPGGECTRGGDWFALHVGFEVIDTEPGDAVVDPEFRSFTVLMGRHSLAGPEAAPAAADGAYTEAVVTFATPGRSYLVEDKTVVLAGDRSAGTVTGAAFRGEGPGGDTEASLPVTGVFTCDAAAIPLEDVPGVVGTEGDV